MKLFIQPDKLTTTPQAHIGAYSNTAYYVQESKTGVHEGGKIDLRERLKVSMSEYRCSDVK